MNKHTQGNDLPSERSDGTRGDLKAQEGGGSTPGATLEQLKIDIGFAIGHGHYMDDNARESSLERIMDSVEALIDTATTARLLALPSMQDNKAGDVYEGSALPMQFTEVYIRNELRASLWAEVSGEKKGESN